MSECSEGFMQVCYQRIVTTGTVKYPKRNWTIIKPLVTVTDKDVDVWIRNTPVGEIKSDEQSHLSQEYKSPSA